MSQNPASRRRVGQQVATPPRRGKSPRPDVAAPAPQPGKAPDPAPGPVPPAVDRTAHPHQDDGSVNGTAAAPDPMMVQARLDLEAGLVDTDMRATAGLDAARRAALVPGAGGKPPSTRRRSP